MPDAPAPDDGAPDAKPNDDHRVALPPPPDEPAELIETPEALAAWVQRLDDCASVAIDTEANSMFVYRETTCILQITAAGESAIVDVLAVGSLAPLRDAMDRDDLEVIFHGGDYDITVLTRDHDFRFTQVFDTMIAATLLGDVRVGLAALVEDHFGHVLNKKYQRADWGRRPLTPPQLDYLRRDTIYLPILRDHYRQRLEVADLVTIRLDNAAPTTPQPFGPTRGAAVPPSSDRTTRRQRSIKQRFQFRVQWFHNLQTFHKLQTICQCEHFSARDGDPKCPKTKKRGCLDGGSFTYIQTKISKHAHQRYTPG